MSKRIGAIALAAASLIWAGAAAAEQCHSGPFNGLYVGGSVGYADMDFSARPEFDPKLSGDDGGVIVGGHVGYNVQCGRVVVGVEGDLSYLDLKASATDADGATFIKKLDALGTLRGRLGYTIRDDIMLYATAGLAFGDVTHKLADPANGFSQSDSDWTTGFVVGGGVEFLRHERWLLRAEVLWTDFSDESYTYRRCGGACSARVKWEEDALVARVGFSVKLGHEEPYHQPLK